MSCLRARYAFEIVPTENLFDCCRNSLLFGHQPEAALSPHWHRKRHWFIPVQHCLLSAVQAGRRDADAAARFQLSLAAPRLAWLWEHRVAGRAILPGAAMFEAAFAAARVTTGRSIPSTLSACTQCLKWPRTHPNHTGFTNATTMQQLIDQTIYNSHRPGA